MTVYIINRELGHDKQYQIMIKSGYGFNHVFPGKLFTISEAIRICDKNNYTIAGGGTLWECL